jgi:chaperonin cofactor prefoldin
MTLSLAEQLEKVQTAIGELLDRLADDAVQEYQIGRRIVKRADFAATLETLWKQETALQGRLARQSGGRVRVAKLGRARGTDR